MTEGEYELYEKQGTIVINTPEGIAHYQLVAVKAALRLEVQLGMKGKVNPLPVAKKILESYGKVPARTKRQVLAQIEDLYAHLIGGDDEQDE